MVSDFPGAEYVTRERDRAPRDWIVPDRLRDIGVPTLVLVGQHELPGFRGFADEAADCIPGARLEVLPDAGHLLPMEHPEIVGRMIVEHASGL
jgi:pimeloyl-ACP methyl ester carboxylesterase